MSTTRPHICAEWEPHRCCLMAWPWRVDIWGRLLPGIRRDIECLAKTIARYEPVVMLVPTQASWQPDRSAWPDAIHCLPFEYDDIWVRDTGPIWLSDHSAIVPRFNAWGQKKISGYPIPHALDATLAERLCKRLGVRVVDLGLVVEGGAIESDGKGKLLLTCSNMLHKKRNSSLDAAAIESIFKRHLDAGIVWLPGARSRHDYTDGHVDAIARYTPSGHLLHDEMDEADACDAKDEYAAVRRNVDAIRSAATALRRPRGQHANAFETYSYANFYVAETVVFMPQFGTNDPVERRIYEIVEKAYEREVVPVNLPTLFNDSGGGIHCVVRDVPAWIARDVPTFTKKLNGAGKLTLRRGLNGSRRNRKKVQQESRAELRDKNGRVPFPGNHRPRKSG